MIEPDNREGQYYNVMNYLMIEPNSASHYFTNLINSVYVLDDGSILPICVKCNDLDFGYILSGGDTSPVCDRCGSTKLAKETIKQTIERVQDKILDVMIEPSGHKLSIFVIEQIIAGVYDLDKHFETMCGNVTLRDLLIMMEDLRKVIRDRMQYYRMTIRFSAQLRTPPKGMY